jgi:hypothetical protein
MPPNHLLHCSPLAARHPPRLARDRGGRAPLVGHGPAHAARLASGGSGLLLPAPRAGGGNSQPQACQVVDVTLPKPGSIHV